MGVGVVGSSTAGVGRSMEAALSVPPVDRVLRRVGAFSAFVAGEDPSRDFPLLRLVFTIALLPVKPVISTSSPILQVETTMNSRDQHLVELVW